MTKTVYIPQTKAVKAEYEEFAAVLRRQQNNNPRRVALDLQAERRRQKRADGAEARRTRRRRTLASHTQSLRSCEASLSASRLFIFGQLLVIEI